MQKFWTVIGFFATATPVGILLGVILSSMSNSNGAAAVSALASGGLPEPMRHIFLMLHLAGMTALPVC
jgi:hypothetical protein